MLRAFLGPPGPCKMEFLPLQWPQSLADSLLGFSDTLRAFLGPPGPCKMEFMPL